MNSTTRKYRGKGAKPAMLHVNVRLPPEVVDHFKTFPNYTKEMRRVLKEHVTKAIPSQQRWQDMLAEENEDETIRNPDGGVDRDADRCEETGETTQHNL